MPETPDAPRGGVPEFRGAGRSLEVLRAEAHDEAGLARLLAEVDAQLAASGVVRG